MQTVGLYTLGCKVSQYETQAIAEAFEARGFSVAPFSSVCDVYVINTCTVTGESDRKSGQMIRRAIKKNPEAVVCVVGCYSQRSPEQVAAISGVNVVVGTENKLSVVDMAIDMLKNGKRRLVSTTDLSDAVFEKMSITRAERTRVYVKIQDGCQSKCSYCAIAAARGPLRSKPFDEVVREVEALAASGVREVVLTGIETGSYGRDLEPRSSLGDLISELDRRHSCSRIRLGSLAPELCGEDFVSKISGCSILAPHFHLSLQSGSDPVLRNMRRRYNAKGALDNIAALRRAFPGASFTTDIMVGFPGETEDDHRMTIDFIRRAELLDIHVFAYSKRAGTPAAEMGGQISPEVKKRRSEEITEAKNLVRDGILERIVTEGTPLVVVCESIDKDGSVAAHSDAFIEVRFAHPCAASLVGEMCEVRPVSHKDGIVYGELLKICK